MQRELDPIGMHLRNHAIFGAGFAPGFDLFVRDANTARLFPGLHYASLPGLPGAGALRVAGAALMLSGLIVGRNASAAKGPRTGKAGPPGPRPEASAPCG